MFYAILTNQFDGLELTYIAISILLAIAVVAALIAQIFVAVGYWRGNRVQNSLGLTGEEFARKLLDENGMPDVQVKKCGILRTLFFGNHYSIMKRTVYLRIFTIRKASVTSAAIAAQKVALAEAHRNGDRKMIIRGRLQGLGVFAPCLFIPLVIIGLVIDLLVMHFLIFTGIALILGLAFIVFSFIVTLLNIPVEKKAIVRAQEWLNASLTPEENERAKKIFRCYMVEYVLQFIVALLRLIQLILKIFLKARQN